MQQTLIRQLKENRRFLLFLFLMILFRSSLADWNSVPTGSMKPTILEGDRIWVNKLAYDVKLPFTGVSLYTVSDPGRGDIVVFESSRADERLVKRVIGLPGDTVELRTNHLLVNGKAAAYAAAGSTDGAPDLTEAVAGNRHRILLTGVPSPGYDSFGPVRVPPGQYLVLGDNRDSSADSRVFGFVPRAEIIGRADNVVLSLDYGNHYLPRGDRFLKTLE